VELLATGRTPFSRLADKYGGKANALLGVVCLIVAIVAGVLGFGGVAGTATDMARILFVVFLILLSSAWLCEGPFDAVDSVYA
jgi:uncharacterized membrane protein YtjA (UPF0391 family)